MMMMTTLKNIHSDDNVDRTTCELIKEILSGVIAETITVARINRYISKSQQMFIKDISSVAAEKIAGD